MNRRRLSLASTIVALFLSLPLHAQSFVRCWRQSIVGFETEHKTAVATLKGTASTDLKGLQLYITSKRFPGSIEPQLYVHTNFKPFGQDNYLKLAFPKSTIDKVFDGDPPDLARLLSSVLQQEGVATADEKVAEQATLFVDPRLYSDFPTLRTGSAHEVFTTPKEGVAIRQLEMTTIGGKVRRLSRVAPPPPNARLYLSEGLFSNSGILKLLENAHFSKSDVMIISTVRDEASGKLLRNLPAEQRQIRTDLTKESLFKALKDQPGKMKLVMGHIQEGSLVLSIDGATKVPLAALETFAAAEHVSIGIIGCESAISDQGIVVSRYINSATATTQLLKAMEAKNYLEFFQLLSSSDMEIVVNEYTVAALENHRSAVTKGQLYASKMISDGGTLPQPQGIVTLIVEANK